MIVLFKPDSRKRSGTPINRSSCASMAKVRYSASRVAAGRTGKEPLANDDSPPPDAWTETNTCPMARSAFSSNHVVVDSPAESTSLREEPSSRRAGPESLKFASTANSSAVVLKRVTGQRNLSFGATKRGRETSVRRGVVTVSELSAEPNELSATATAMKRNSPVKSSGRMNFFFNDPSSPTGTNSFHRMTLLGGLARTSERREAPPPAPNLSIVLKPLWSGNSSR